jgi:hypothetical protein
MTLEEGGDGVTRNRHAMSWAPALGPAGRMLDAALKPSLRRDVRSTPERLRAILEREAGHASTLAGGSGGAPSPPVRA